MYATLRRPLALALLALPLGAQEPLPGTQLDRALDHYQRVENELVRSTRADLTPDQSARRAALVAALRDYRLAQVFGINRIEADARLPQFVDDEGRRCAVAQLLHTTGDDALVELVRTIDNGAWVVDLEHDTEFHGWLRHHGLTLWEAARIQIPSLGGRGGPRDTGPGSGGPGSGGPASGGPATPAPDAPAGPESGRPSRGPGSPAGSPGGGLAGGNGPSTPGSGAAPGGLALGDANESWWVWWEHNKLDFLRPNRLRLWDGPISGEDVEGQIARQMLLLRRTIVPVLRQMSREGDADLRAAAAVALGRIGGPEAVPALIERLDDPSALVRSRAILALGATGSPDAAQPLLAIARTGRHDAGRGADVVANARGLAIVGLALGRRLGMDAAIDKEVAKIVASPKKADRRELGVAGLIYHRLAPCAELEGPARELAAGRSGPVEVRCRAAESLGSGDAGEVLSELMDLLHGPRLEVRRSAALALGTFDHDLVLPALLTAAEAESEPMARGFVLASIGRQGGPKAREALARELEEGPKSQRAWAALGLGLALRGEDHAESRALLREGAAKERNAMVKAAFWVACGLAGDVESIDMLAEALREDSSPRRRMYAATALTLVGTESARTILLERLEDERSPLVRVAIAQGLGVYGRVQDAQAILEVLDDVRDPSLQGLAAVAAGFHGSGEALRQLVKRANDEKAPRVARASAVDAIGLLLGVSEPLVFSEISSGSNYLEYSDWVNELLQVSL